MTKCYFCQEKDKNFFSYFCDECSTLRRLLLINEPEKCINILKRVLLRNDTQISNKIKLEVRKIEKEKESNDQDDYEPPKTRNNNNNNNKAKI